MAGPVGGNQPFSIRKRVFVLVADQNVQGVFTSWDAAEQFAERNSLPLDRLMEYETARGDPDHLHLMTVQWENTWAFHGQWPRKAPRWPYPPKKVRLDHYHQRGDKFYLFRQKEFEWQEDLFMKINPMAPDRALEQNAPTVRADTGLKQAPPSKGLKPVLGPVGKIEKDKPEPDSKPDTPVKKEETSVPKEETSEKKEPVKLAEPVKPGTKKPLLEPEVPDQPPEQVPFKKKPALRLKTGKSPQPIPTFQTTPLVEEEESVSSVEMAYSDPAAAPRKKASEQPVGKAKRVWSIKLILPLVALVACWAGGIWWALRPEPTAAMKVAEVVTISSASKIVLEPDTVFFQLPVDPIHQERWIQTLGMQPINEMEGVRIPTHHALSIWEEPNKYVRPPYALVEVDEWMNIKLRDVRYGFVYEWEDGCIIILDLESDQMIGWTRIKDLSEVMN
ncbi:MAG: hypothetical protein AB3N63_16025 [Puniceicoccaceae bacterium]